MKDENEEEKDNDEDERGDCREVLATAGVSPPPPSLALPPRTLNTLLCSHSLLLTTRQGVEGIKVELGVKIVRCVKA